MKISLNNKSFAYYLLMQVETKENWQELRTKKNNLKFKRRKELVINHPMRD